MSLEPEEICKRFCTVNGHCERSADKCLALQCGQEVSNHYETVIIPARIKEERQKLIDKIESAHNLIELPCIDINPDVKYSDCLKCPVPNTECAGKYWQQLKQESE